MLYIGIDVGGTTAKAGVVDENGHILVKSSCKTGIERGFEDIAADMAALCHRIVRESGHTMDEIAAAGVGIPGEQSPKTGRLPKAFSGLRATPPAASLSPSAQAWAAASCKTIASIPARTAWAARSAIWWWW